MAILSTLQYRTDTLEPLLSIPPHSGILLFPIISMLSSYALLIWKFKLAVSLRWGTFFVIAHVFFIPTLMAWYVISACIFGGECHLL